MCLLVQSLSILDLSVSTARQLLDKVDCLLISPHSTTLKSHVKVMRITDMITNIKELLIVTHSPCQYHRKCKENINSKARLKGLFLL